MDERIRMIQLRRCRTESIFSSYDNSTLGPEIQSKWSIVRQRLPDILALSTTYKPTNIRTQLVLLIALMNRQAHQLRRLTEGSLPQTLSCSPTSVTVNIDNRTRIISLKRIPPEQMIHVDVDGLVFSIPTRKFLIAISQGYAQETAAKYCPPAITDMVIKLSKIKVADDRRQYKRALFKRRVGKAMFFSLFTFISGMILALILSAGMALLKLSSFDHKNPNVSAAAYSSSIEMDEY